MSDPQRLVDDPTASPLARQLLGTAISDRPAATTRASVAKRLGIVALTLTGTEGGSAVAASAIWWKLGIVLALLGGAGGIALLAWPASEPALVIPAAIDPPAMTPPLTRISPNVVVAESPAPPAPPAPEPAIAEPAVVVPVVVAPAVAEPVIVEPALPPIVVAPVQSVDARRLAAEVAVLDRARTALRRGDARTALAALDTHRREFADGALVAEAEVVRLEVLVATRQTAAARDQARTFLTRFPSSPLARRVRSLVDHLKEAP